MFSWFYRTCFHGINTLKCYIENIFWLKMWCCGLIFFMVLTKVYMAEKDVVFMVKMDLLYIDEYV